MTTGLAQHQESYRQPLVTVGIPTYNRPAGLRRTLEGVTAQTYRHLEIIVADNASPDPNVATLAREYENKDSRIRYFRHESNLGAHANFGFVLRRATGPLFMWWADDDERAVDAIEYYVANIGDSGGCFSTFAVRDYATMSDSEFAVPLLTGLPQQKADIVSFLEQLRSSMFYGLLRTDAAQDCWIDSGYDWFDCNFVLRLIANYGFRTLKSEPKYFAGVHGGYVAKPINGKALVPWPYFFRTLPLALRGGTQGVGYHVKHLKGVLRWRRQHARDTKGPHRS